MGKHSLNPSRRKLVKDPEKTRSMPRRLATLLKKHIADKAEVNTLRGTTPLF